MTQRSYTYEPKFDEENNLFWQVHEKATDQIVAMTFFEEDAREYMDFLEGGGAFAGFTPSFMLRKSPVGMDEAFSLTFVN